MNKFKEELAVHNYNLKQFDTFKDKVQNAVFQAILNIETNSAYEQMEKIDMMNDLNKILGSYEELRPILTEYFERKRNNEKWREK